MSDCATAAEDCARQAKTAPTETLRAEYLRHERRWSGLARSREFEQRLTLFINGTRRRKNAGDRGIGPINADRPAAERARGRLPGRSQTGNDQKHLQNELITIVDDDDCVCGGLGALIESRGHIAATFAAAEDYLASNVKENTTCLILDVHLPGMSGPDLQAHLIADGCCPPTVFVTGRFEEHVQKRVIEAGALGYLRKPCNEQALLDCIEQVLGAIR